MDIEALWSQYMRGQGLSRTSIRRRINTLHALGRWMAPASYLDATTDDVVAWLARQQMQWTRYGYFHDSRLFFRWAHARGVIATNPMAELKAPRPGEAAPRPLTVEQLRYALAMSAGNMRLILLLGSHAGLRIGEICMLHSDHVNLFGPHPVLVVRHGKGAKDRVVPLHRELVIALSGRRGWIVAKANGGHYRSTTLSTQVTEFFQSLGIHATSHCLRHSFGTAVAESSNGNLIIVAQLMGHSNPKQSLGYIKLCGEHWGVIDGMWPDAA